MKMTEEGSINFPIVFHFHQPVDQLEHIYEDVFKKSYNPLIKSIHKFPELKVTLHFSGNLLEWLIQNKPNFIAIIKEMAENGQIELIGGGFYEPIFSVIPIRDAIAQMRKLSDLIKKEFGLDVHGAWLSERVWEPNYPSFLREVGYKYVIVDDNHFRATGITQNDTLYTYNTEDEGRSIRVFPINEPLRYLSPWKPTHYSIEYLRSLTNNHGDRIALFISDAEKMGVWGTTHQICYVDGKGHEEGDEGKPFIPTFFEKIVNNDWIKTLTLSEYMFKYPAKELVYLPTSSYDKMEEWVLLTPIRKKFAALRKRWKDDPRKQDQYMFLKGGFWRYFLVKYPESNNMHKKMLYVREKLISIEQLLDELGFNEYSKEIKNAWNEIYQSQCNDCYWHGLFGGVYLQFLRFSVYTHLINAERIIDKLNQEINSIPKKYISIMPLDFNKDSKMEIIIESELVNIYVDPDDGGTIFELDFKPKSYNVLNTLTRWLEAYHDAKDADSEKIMTDRYKRSMFRVRFFKNIDLNKLHHDNYEEYGDLGNNKYNVVKTLKSGSSAVVKMNRAGFVRDPITHETLPIILDKQVELNENKLIFTITGKFEKLIKKEEILKNIIENLFIGIDFPFFFNGEPEQFKWESNQVIFAGDIENALLEPFEYSGIHFAAHDGEYNLSLELQVENKSKKDLDKVKIFKFPIIAYAFTDEGYKQIYQGLNVLTRFNLKREFEYKIILKLD